MVDKLRSTFRKYPFLYKWLSTIYQKFLAPIRSGHLQYYLKYLFTVKKGEIKRLEGYGLKDITPFRYREWRIGRGKDGAHRRYYVASYQGRRCFMKIGLHDATMRNECQIMTVLKQKPLTFTPNLLARDITFSSDTTMIAIEYLDGLSKFVVPEDRVGFENICKQFLSILDELESRELVHADIHKGNLMMQGDKLILLDFGISKFQNMQNEINYLHRPGTFYRKKEDGRIYDDAYSFVKMLEAQNASEELLGLDVFQEIKKRIDRNSFFTPIEENCFGCQKSLTPHKGQIA